jgi:hypothetical protein
MSVVQISEFSDRRSDHAGHKIDVLGVALVTQKLTISNTAASSNPVGTSLIRIVAQADCCVAVGPAPTATNLASTTPSDFFPAGTIEVRWINTGDKVSVIAA